MFSTIRKRAANRANAQHSTGPVTAEGKETVSRNSTKHGLTGRFFVLEGEGQENYDALLNQFMEDEKPVGNAEIELVKKMAQYTWLSLRAHRLQDGCFVIINQTEERRAKGQAELHVRPELERYTRYQAHHDRGYQRASKELRDRRKEREKAERGFVSQKHSDAKEARATEMHVQRLEAAQAKETRAAELHVVKLVTFKAKFTASNRNQNLAEPGFISQNPDESAPPAVAPAQKQAA